MLALVDARLVVLTPVLWPTDALLFESQPELLAFFGYWRPPVLALAVITLLGLRFSATVRRNATLFAHIALVGGAAICGVANGGASGIHPPSACSPASSE